MPNGLTISIPAISFVNTLSCVLVCFCDSTHCPWLFNRQCQATLLQSESVFLKHGCDHLIVSVFCLLKE